MNYKNIKVLLYSFSNYLFSIPIVYFGLTSFSKDELKADWQPPGYVFGIVWPILYILFGIINIKTFTNKTISDNVKNMLIKQSLREAIGQTLWLLVTSNFGKGRTFIQYFIGLFILGFLVNYAFTKRRPNLALYDSTSFYLYIPYTLWIMFAFILNLQIVLKFIMKGKN